MGTLVELGPEAVLEALLRVAQALGLRAHQVEMREHADHARHPVRLADRQELEALHLEARRRVHQQQRLRIETDTLFSSSRHMQTTALC